MRIARKKKTISSLAKKKVRKKRQVFYLLVLLKAKQPKTIQRNEKVYTTPTIRNEHQSFAIFILFFLSVPFKILQIQKERKDQ